jgi:N-formylglutamate deformylase
MSEVRPPEAEWMLSPPGQGLPAEVPLILTIPHSGQVIPPEAGWLKSYSEQFLQTDLDSYVDELYRPAAARLRLPALVVQVHRYAADLNRFPDDVDCESVEGDPRPAGTFPIGFHWVYNTLGQKILPNPLPKALHDRWVQVYHDRFHEEFARGLGVVKSSFPGRVIRHLDCHSMPSQGRGIHQDAGKARPDVVISDVNGKSASGEYMVLVCGAFEAEGFTISRNWPYQGGRITQRYGRPEQGHETIQIELNRALYMDEKTRQKTPGFDRLQARLEPVLRRIVEGLRSLP